MDHIDFQEQETGFTGNEGTSQSKWYTLVVQSAEQEFEQLAEAPTRGAVATLAQFVTSNSPQVHAFAERFLARKYSWFTDDPEFLQCLGIVEQLNDVNLFFKLLRSVKYYFKFQPRVRKTMLHFEWETCVEDLLRSANEAEHQNRMSLICSFLDGETDPAHIAHVLESLDLRITMPVNNERSYNSTSNISFPRVEELARILVFVQGQSEEPVTEILATFPADKIPNLVVPALVLLAETKTLGTVLLEYVKALQQTLEATLPALRNASFRDTKVGHECTHCHALQAFLSSDGTDQTQITVQNQKELKHVETRLTRVNRHRRDTIQFAPVSPLVLQLSKHFGKNKSLTNARGAIKALIKLTLKRPVTKSRAVLGATTIKAKRTKPRAPCTITKRPTAIRRTPVTSQPTLGLAPPPRAAPLPTEIIEIDDSD